MNLPETLFDLLASASGETPAIVSPENQVTVSYASLRRQIESVASELVLAGIRPGDRVAMALPNGLSALVCFLAAAIAGAAAPLNPAYRQDEIRFHLEDIGARLLLLPREGGDAARRAAGDRIPVITTTVDARGQVRLSAHGRRPSLPSPSPDAVALVLHTSSSSGRPKCVALTHANLTASVGNIVRTYGLTGDDISLCVMPLFHVHGLVASVLSTLASGGRVVLQPRFHPLGFWRLVRDQRVTWYSAVPTMHRLLLARAGKDHPDVGRLRFIRSCSAALAPDTMYAAEQAFGVPVLEAYGMTEASHQIASNPLPPRPRKPGSVGPGTNVKVSIVDADGRHLEAGAHGEVVISGANIIRGYENNPEANAASFVDGWFRTGDLGFLDADGYLVLVARIKELINRGGEKIAPREIDEVLQSHPSVAEAVAFGAPHRIWGEEVEAVVVLRDAAAASPAELLAHCRHRLAAVKCPKKVHLVHEIPRTATGKIQRRLVAAMYASQLT